MQAPPTIRVVGVCEQDIDLLLLEEFISSSRFLNWFTAKLNLPDAILLEASRGVANSMGESDLMLKVQTPTGDKVCIHIENKIAANFQPQQVERYAMRGEQQVESGDACDYRVCLFAPSNYIEGVSALDEFDLAVTYEEIRSWLADSPLEDGRKYYKGELLKRALEKASFGWQLEEDVAVTELWRDYWLRSRETAKVLQMPQPKPRAATSGFVCFAPPDIPKGVKLMHKLRHGNVDLQFAGMGREVGRLHEVLGDLLEEDMRIERANKSAVIRMKVPVLNLQGSCEDQVEKIDVGLQACLRMYEWWGRNRGAVEEVMRKASATNSN